MAQSGYNPEFQEQLIQEYLLEQGRINPEQLSKAVARLRQYKIGQQGKQRAVSYVFDQRSYALQEIDPWTGDIRRQLPLPTSRKHKPRFMTTDWVPTGSGSVFLFHASNARELGEIAWASESQQGGLTVSDEYTHLYFGELDEHPYLALSEQLHYGQIPMQKLSCLPVDIVMSPTRQQLFLADRSRGTIFIVDLPEFKLVGSLIVRPPGSRKTLNLAASPDGARLFVTDNVSPALLIINLKSLKIKRQPLPYGILGNLRLSPDGQWIYLQSTRPDETVELLVLDTTNLLQRSTVNLHGNLFSTLDDPVDLMAVSPQNNFLIFMTYVNAPSMFTPWINIVDLDNYQLVDRYALLTDDSKPSYLSFAIAKPEGYFKVDATILDVLLEMGYITIQDVEEAEWTIHETLNRSAADDEPQLSLDSFGDDDEILYQYDPAEDSDLDAIEQGRGNPEEDYPVLNEHQIDPSILIQFKETLLRQYEFVPINQLNGIFRIAAVNPSRPEIEQIAKRLFPDVPLFMLPFGKDEFERFMREFYSTIMTRMKNIVSRMSPDQRAEFSQTAPAGVVENLENYAAPAYQSDKSQKPDKPPAEPPVETDPTKPAPQRVAPARSLARIENAAEILPPEPEPAEPEIVEPPAATPTPEPLPPPSADAVDWAKIPADKLNQLLLEYCLNEFKKIWGIDVAGDVGVIERLQPLVERARRELMNFEYTIVRVPDLFNQFSLETVITKETFLTLVARVAPPEPVKPQPVTQVQELAAKVQEAAQAPALPPAQVKAGASKTAQIQFEADDAVLRSDDLPSDTFLVGDHERHRIIEFTTKGVIGWQIGGVDGIGDLELVEPQNPIRLPNGNTLLADAGQDTVFEVSKSGQVRWQFPPADKSSDIRLHRPVKAMRKLNGNTIIVDQGNHRIIEINPQNKIIWQYGITASVGITRGRVYSPSDMQPLKGGHFLITDTDNHRVIEVNADEEIIWQYGNPENKLGSGYGSLNNQLNAPTQAFRLPNGNTLIADSENRRVIEVNPEREIVWVFDTGIEKASGGAFSFIPVRMIRMGNGNTVVFSPLYVIEVTRLVRPLYLYQYANLPKSKDYSRQVDESEKIIELSTKPTREHIKERANQAAQKYVVSKANLTDVEIPLIDKQENRIYLVNRQKQIVWRLGEDSPRHPLHLERPQHVELSLREDSEVMVADTDNHRVIRIYRPTKEITWQYGEKGVMGSRPGLLGHPRSAVLTPDRTVLITDQYSGRVLEIDAGGRIIWQFGGWDTGINPLNAPYYAEPTPDGSVLITDWSNHYVIEVSREGEIIWQYGTLKNPGAGPHQLMYPERAHRLINGNTLIVDTRNHRCLEVDPSGGIPWQFGGSAADASKKITNPSEAYRLENGNTLIVHSGNRQLSEVTMHHQLVWQYLLPSNRR